MDTLPCGLMMNGTVTGPGEWMLHYLPPRDHRLDQPLRELLHQFPVPERLVKAWVRAVPDAVSEQQLTYCNYWAAKMVTNRSRDDRWQQEHIEPIVQALERLVPASLPSRRAAPRQQHRRHGAGWGWAMGCEDSDAGDASASDEEGEGKEALDGAGWTVTPDAVVLTRAVLYHLQCNVPVWDQLADVVPTDALMAHPDLAAAVGGPAGRPTPSLQSVEWDHFVRTHTPVCRAADRQYDDRLAQLFWTPFERPAGPEHDHTYLDELVDYYANGPERGSLPWMAWCTPVVGAPRPDGMSQCACQTAHALSWCRPTGALYGLLGHFFGALEWAEAVPAGLQYWVDRYVMGRFVPYAYDGTSPLVLADGRQELDTPYLAMHLRRHAANRPITLAQFHRWLGKRTPSGLDRWTASGPGSSPAHSSPFPSPSPSRRPTADERVHWNVWHSPAGSPHSLSRRDPLPVPSSPYRSPKRGHEDVDSVDEDRREQPAAVRPRVTVPVPVTVPSPGLRESESDGVVLTDDALTAWERMMADALPVDTAAPVVPPPHPHPQPPSSDGVASRTIRMQRRVWSYDRDVRAVASIQWVGWDPVLLLTWLEKVLLGLEQIPSPSARLKKFHRDLHLVWKQWGATMQATYCQYQCLDIPSISPGLGTPPWNARPLDEALRFGCD